MKFLSNETVTLKKSKLTIGMWLTFVLGALMVYCVNKVSREKKYDNAKQVIHDTVIIEKRNSHPMIDESKLQGLLIQYYKSGWMDASNGIIDLNNSMRFDDKNLSILRNKDWRRIEKEVKSK